MKPPDQVAQYLEKKRLQHERKYVSIFLVCKFQVELFH